MRKYICSVSITIICIISLQGCSWIKSSKEQSITDDKESMRRGVAEEDSYSWECSPSAIGLPEIGYSYRQVRKLWKSLNCKNTRRGRKLVVFLDGTWNDHTTHTNILKLYNLAMEHAKDHAIIPYYDKGVGSHKFDTFRGGLLGYGTSRNIRQAYRFLVEAYEPGDQIYIFGFSRGALAARSLNGIIKFVGLLKEDSINKERIKEMWLWERISFLLEINGRASTLIKYPLLESTKNKKEYIYYTLFRDLVSDLYKGYHIAPDDRGDIRVNIENNKKSVIQKYSDEKYDNYYNKIEFWHPQVEVIGVFDTVPCLGKKCTVNPKKHRTDLYAKKGFHALSIDEVRGKFQLLRFPSSINGEILEEVWFSGGHSDVGGGYDSSYATKKSCDSENICTDNYDGSDKKNYYHGLETAPLNWMIDKIKDENIVPNNLNFPECNIGKLHNEYYGYNKAEKRLAGGHFPRNIQSGDTISPSAKKRWDSKCLFDPYREYEHEKNEIYRPKNLQMHLNKET